MHFGTTPAFELGNWIPDLLKEWRCEDHVSLSFSFLRSLSLMRLFVRLFKLQEVLFVCLTELRLLPGRLPAGRLQRPAQPQYHGLSRARFQLRSAT